MVMDIVMLKQEIEKIREEMALLVVTKGLTNEATVESSQKLDYLLNLLHDSKTQKL